MSTQTINGKAFEFAFAVTLHKSLLAKQAVELTDNSSLDVAREYFKTVSRQQQANLVLASEAAVSSLKKLEPMLFLTDDDSPLVITLQQDNRGQEGDVRDVIFLRKSHKWEVGISVKHNHEAVKHSRLSPLIDFGEKWLGIPCNKAYFESINPIFDELKLLNQQKKKWSEIENKAERFYIPILQSFIDELKMIDEMNPGVVPSKLVGYLLGVKDFYKVTAQEKSKQTHVQAFSLYGTLNRSAGDIHPQIKLPQIKLPNRFYDISFKPKSKTTLLVALDNGW